MIMVRELKYSMIVLNLILVIIKYLFVSLSNFFFFYHKEKDQRRMGRAAKKRERSGTAEATGEERKRGDSWQWEDKHTTYPLALSDAPIYAC